MNPLEMLKKGISALNPVGTKVDGKGVPRPNPKLLGPKGSPIRDAADKAKKHNKQVQDVANELDKS